ncbi:MAG TPA: FAD-dependent oxidoreductase [Candidatus Aphodomonas merdavium]|nr:FAD-dependent oxidoreductase [Candidatus Aphodomonas merdavium]
MRQTLKTLVALCLVLCLALPCLALAETYAAGTYTAAASGNNGDVTVEVVLSQDAIESVTVTEHSETPGLSDPALERIPAAIVEGQTLAVDAVAGATNTSKAILAAVEACIAQAGGNVEALKVAFQADEAAAETVELSTDLVIVGGGGAGMTAAINARLAGIDVILLEKMATTGGATAICGGSMIITGSELQKQFGEENDSAEAMYADLMNNGHNLNDPEKLKLYTENVGDTADWLVSTAGVAFREDGLMYQAEHSVNRVANFEGSAAGLAQSLRDKVAEVGAEVMLETRADGLVVEDGAVVGVTATAADGVQYVIKADAVLLATGGFGNNVDLLPESLQSVLYYGPVCATGDGHIMAQSVNAKFQMMDLGKIYPNGIEVAPRIGKSTIYANMAACNVAGIIVGIDGNRVWNEKGANKDLLTVLLAQPDQTMYFFMDQASFDAFKTGLANTGITEADVEKYLAANGSEGPLFAHGETVEEVAAIAGIDADALKATIERYNGFVAAGVDEDFGRPAEFLTAQISAEGPYYIVEQKPRFATTLGGVCTTDDFEIINEAGEVIPGLFAAGELIGGVQGDDSPPGSNVGWALTSGRMAGEIIANRILSE